VIEYMSRATVLSAQECEQQAERLSQFKYDDPKCHWRDDHLDCVLEAMTQVNFTNNGVLYKARKQASGLGNRYSALLDALKTMGGVATMSAEYMRRRVKAQMQDGDYVQLWQQMSNAPVPDRLALVKRNFDTTVDWEHFGNVWLEMFADEESNDVNLWKLVEHEQICAVINCLKDKQDAIQAAQQQQGKKQRSSTRGAYGGQSSQPSSWLKPTPKPPPKKRARGGAILVPKSAADAWITKRIEEGLIRGPEDITLPHHFRCSAMGYKAFFTMAYFPLRHFNKPYRCSQAVLMSATTMTLDQLGIEYKVPTTDKNGVCIFSSGDDFVQVNKALQEATGSGSDFLLRKINISSWEVFLQKEGVFILTSRYYENPEEPRGARAVRVPSSLRGLQCVLAHVLRPEPELSP